MRTSELFRFCLGREFKVYGFDGYGFVELRPSDDPDVKREFGNHQTIWIDPEQVEALGAVSTQSLSPCSCDRCGSELPQNFVRCSNCWWPFQDRREV
jgi:hypothetical protein